jgi:pimeloyl-ACP methyl ester carboxylesterase
VSLVLQRLLVFAVVAWIPFAGADNQSAAEVDISDHCKVSSDNGLIRRSLPCHRFRVPEDYNDPDGPTIELFVVKLEARSRSSDADPVLMLAGGPGQAASSAYIQADRYYRSLNEDRDIYLVDQRGTGASTPFACPEFYDFNIVSEPDTEALADVISSCVAAFGHDPRQFTTAVAIRDFEFIRRELGVEKWNLIGTSYGTRVAYQYALTFPNAIRTMVLDAVVPSDLNIHSQIAANSQFALDSLFERCRTDVNCRRAFPDLAETTTRLFASLKRTPKAVRYEDIASGEAREIQFGAGHLAMIVRLALYQDELIAILPYLIHRAAHKGQYEALARTFLTYEESLKNSISMGMHNSVVCSEDVFDSYPVSETHKNTYLGSAQTDLTKRMCEFWPKGEGLKAPSKAAITIPTVMLSGELDPITPPEYAERMSSSFKHVRAYTLPGQGHGVSAIACMPELIHSFVNDPFSYGELESSCIDQLSAFPFFIDSYGPAVKDER